MVAAAARNLVKFECGICGEKRKLPPDALPDGWIVPSRRYGLGGRAQDILPKGVVIAICSAGCLQGAEDAERQRATRRLRDHFS